MSQVGIVPQEGGAGEGPLLVPPSSWQSHLDREGSGRGNWETFGRGGLWRLQRWHLRQPCVGEGKGRGGRPQEGPPSAGAGWDEAGSLSAAFLGALVLLGGIFTLQVTLGRAPMCQEWVPPPHRVPGLGARAAWSSHFWVKFLPRLERSRFWSTQAADAIPG